MTNKLVLVDGSSVLSKNYYGTLPFEYKKAKTPEEKAKAMEKTMKTSDGQYTNAVYGMMKFLLKVIKEQKPTHLVIMWDKSRDTFRRELYSDYKGTRGETPKPLSSQFGLAQHLLEEVGISTYVHNDFEADDIIGTFAKKFENDMSTYIITGDQDALQLITERTRVWLSTGKAKDLYESRGLDIKELDVPDGCFEYTPITFEEEYGIKPIQIIDMKALEGDSSDNIPGVAGMGPKSVLPLIQEYGTIEAIYDVVENNPEDELKKFFKEELGISQSPIGKLLKKPNSQIAEEIETLLSQELDKKMSREVMKLFKEVDDKEFKEKVKELATVEESLFKEKASQLSSVLKEMDAGVVGKKAAFLSKDLATIRTNIEDYQKVTLDDVRLNIDKAAMKQKFQELEFKSLIDKI